LVRLSLEVRDKTNLVRVVVRATSIRLAEDAVRSRYPYGEVRVVFPIDEGGFFGGAGGPEIEAEHPVSAAGLGGGAEPARAAGPLETGR
jgi:hypothetical protein